MSPQLESATNSSNSPLALLVVIIHGTLYNLLINLRFLRLKNGSNQVNKSMEGVVKGMGSALKTMDVERISRTMDNFEQQFEDMDVRAGYMENAMSSSTAQSTPQEQVDGLIQMVADEAGLELGEQLDNAGPVSSKVPSKPATEQAETDGEDELANRLAALRK